MGVAPLTISPFARWLITAYDWRSAMFVAPEKRQQFLTLLRRQETMSYSAAS